MDIPPSNMQIHLCTDKAALENHSSAAFKIPDSI